MNSSEKLNQVLDFLNAKKHRATYGAVAGYVGVKPRSVGTMLGAPSPRSSWVVMRDTHLPSKDAGYTEADYHPELQRKSEALTITTTQKLTMLIES